MVGLRWDEMLKWWKIAHGTLTAKAVRAGHRVHVIGSFLKEPYKLHNECVTQADIGGLLDELPGYFDSIDVAKELHSMGALKPLLCLLYEDHDDIRAKTAKFISSMVQNIPSSQQIVIEADGNRILYDTFFKDCNPIVETNILNAISSLYQKNDKHGISAFGQRGGYADMKYELESYFGANVQRKCLNFIARLVQEHNSDCNIVTGLKYPNIMMSVALGDDAEVRKAAFKCLRVLARVEELVRVEGGNSGQLVKNDNKLNQVLQEVILKISAMPLEDLRAAREEIQLVDSLWNACYNKPSPLQEKGLLVLPSEDALGPRSAATPTI